MITSKPIDSRKVLSDFPVTASGAVASFAGVVRERNNGRDVDRIFYECYEAMAYREIEKLIAEAKANHGINSAEIIHRTGDVAAGETSLFVVVSAPHRKAAFDAISEMIDKLKDRLPVWKKEYYRDDTSAWL